VISITQILNTTKITLFSPHIPHKLLDLIIVLFLDLFGYWLNPKDLLPGNYIAQIEVSFISQIINSNFPFSLGDQSGKPVMRIQVILKYQPSLEVEGS
jgi:hypothetical protein